MTTLLLAGGAEFTGQMAAADQYGLAAAGGLAAPVAIIPAAAAPDNNHRRAAAIGCRWFRGLGAVRVAAVFVVDRASADDPALAHRLATARLIYLLGGFPGYLAETLAHTASWQAIERVFSSGGVVAGSSAGAMVLCSHLYDPSRQQVRPGLGLLANTLFIPHFDTFGSGWPALVEKALSSDTRILAVDEQTAVASCQRSAGWLVLGGGSAHLYKAGHDHHFPAGSTIPATLLRLP